MRDKICKAKRKDNREWIEGYYFCMAHNDGRHIHHFIIPIGVDLSLGTPIEKIQVEIDIDTLCDNTGLTDKNGRKIWENDIIRDEEIQALGKVEYIEDSFYLNDVHDGKQYIEGFWNSFEVIGNIFDNSELLKGGE